MTTPSFRPTVTTAAVLGLCIALGPIGAGLFVYKSVQNVKANDRYVTVRGLVEKTIKADRGALEITFKVSGNDLSQMHKKLLEDSEHIQQFVQQEGFTPKEIGQTATRVTDLHMREFGNNSAPSPERYLIEHTVTVNSPQVDKLKILSGKTGELIQKGISVSYSNVRYYLDKFNQLRPQLISQAMKNATEVAQSFADTTGSQIGGIRQANQGVIRLTSPDVSPNQEYDDGAGSLIKQIRVVSTVQFFLK